MNVWKFWICSCQIALRLHLATITLPISCPSWMAPSMLSPCHLVPRGSSVMMANHLISASLFRNSIALSGTVAPSQWTCRTTPLSIKLGAVGNDIGTISMSDLLSAGA